MRDVWLVDPRTSGVDEAVTGPDLRHGQLPAFDPQTDDERLIAENIDAPLSVCPYGSRFGDSDSAHPCFAVCLGEC
jgi:hypothetical protein